MKSPLVAGLISAIPLAIVLVIYVLVRGKALALFFLGQADGVRLSANALFWLMLGGFVAMAFGFGALSGLVYGWLGMPRYQYLALGATLLFSLLAVISKQPLPGDKIAWNLAIGGILGVLVPLLAR